MTSSGGGMRKGLNSTVDKNCQIRKASTSEARVSKTCESPETADQRERVRTVLATLVVVSRISTKASPLLRCIAPYVCSATRASSGASKASISLYRIATFGLVRSRGRGRSMSKTLVIADRGPNRSEERRVGKEWCVGWSGVL